MTMKPASSDDELSTKVDTPETEKQSLAQASREPLKSPDGPSSHEAASLSGQEKSGRAEDAVDADGEALLEVLRSGKPLTPEEVPDIFSPAEQAARQTALQSKASGGASPASSATSERRSAESGTSSTEASAGAEKAQAGTIRTGQKSQGWQSPGPGVGFAGPPINPRWGVAGGTGAAYSSGGAGTPPGGAGGAWVWLPEGMKPPKSWPRRHPILFWGGCILLLLLVFNWGRMSTENGPLVGSRIAVINVEGIILDASATNAWIEKIRRDPSIKGAVLRVNSPGGAVGPSQEIYAAIKRLDETKPVIASMGALAASGGYYISLGAREIYASPSSLTASIGVKMQLPNFGELMKTIGISETTLATGKLKDAGSSWRTMTPEEEAYLRALIGDMYDEFIQTVARKRELPLETVRGLADGRAMTGRQALEAKLVDKLGDRYEAVRRVMELCQLPESPPVKIVEGPEKPVSMLKELMNSVLEIGVEQTHKAEQPVFMY